ncbi:MAG: hypothetical protein LUD69_07445 [Oscillospiraceae bacterium]|nr:hypothetical protein [Oscillospiraceae bacterium]
MEKANETTEQQAVMDWAAYAVKRWPGQQMRADTAQWKQRWGFPAVKEDI